MCEPITRIGVKVTTPGEPSGQIVPNWQTMDFADFKDMMTVAGGRLTMSPGEKFTIILPNPREGFFRLEGLNKRSPITVTEDTRYRRPSRVPVHMVTIEVKANAKMGAKDRVALNGYAVGGTQPMVSVKFTVNVLPRFCGNDIP